MDKQKEINSSLKFLNYTVSRVNFETNENFKNSDDSIAIDFSIDDNITFNDNNMLITLKLNVFENMIENNYPFSISVQVKGIFETQGKDIERFSINGLAILYPYLRSIVSTYTSNSNVSTLILPPINVVAYLEEKKRSQELNTKK